MIEKTRPCRNCASPLSGSFCAECGQKDVDLERPFGALIAEIAREAVDIDGRAWRTARMLFRHPGLLTSEYLAGRRRIYTPPLRLYLVVSVSFFLLMAWVASQGLLLSPGQTAERDALLQARFLSDELPRLMFVMLPAFAVLLKLVFIRRLYFDHLIFSVHLHCAAYVVLAFMVPIENVAAANRLALFAQAVLLAYLFVYAVIAMRRTYATGWIAAAVRTTAIFFGYMVLVSGVIEATSSFEIISD